VADGALVNDVHSGLNPTRVRRVVRVTDLDSLRRAIGDAAAAGDTLCAAGGRHAMGGQQFASDGVLLDTRGMNRVLSFDAERGLVDVEAGIQWPDLMREYLLLQDRSPHQWGIAQKQTGADRLTVGGALAANSHGRGLRMRPIVQDVESFRLVNGDGEVVECSRGRNAELFRLAVGGYGLFGTVASVTLRLVPRVPVRRTVELLAIDDVPATFARCIGRGDTYGDFQFAIENESPDFLRRGVFSSYRPVDAAVEVPPAATALSLEEWQTLAYLAHVDKGAAFRAYASHYLATSGQLYWSDTHQLSPYLDDYHSALNARLPAGEAGTEIISELYVPRDRLLAFMDDVREDFRTHGVDLIYGTVRLIEEDGETFLPWAKEAYACVVFNLHTPHHAAGLDRSARAFRRLVERALERRGSFSLTYHRFATRDQVDAAYPQFGRFLQLKRDFDARERFQSDWYRHYRARFDAEPPARA
jgi:FAD/FMN-containing dehydrogenase